VFRDQILKNVNHLFPSLMTCVALIHSSHRGIEELQKCHGVEVEAGVSARSITMNATMASAAWSNFKSHGLAKVNLAAQLIVRLLHPYMPPCMHHARIFLVI
jgi:hypothetical protein